MNLPKQDSSTGRAIKTAVQAIVGFVVGLVVVVWNVPGVPHAVVSYTQTHLVDVVIAVGVPTALASGLTSFFWNFLRKDIPNY